MFLLVSLTSDLNFRVILSNALDCVALLNRALCWSEYHSLSKCSELPSEVMAVFFANCVTQLILDITVFYWSTFHRPIEKNRQNFPLDFWLFSAFICVLALLLRVGFHLNLQWVCTTILNGTILPIYGGIELDSFWEIHLPLHKMYCCSWVVIFVIALDITCSQTAE